MKRGKIPFISRLSITERFAFAGGEISGEGWSAAPQPDEVRREAAPAGGSLLNRHWRFSGAAEAVSPQNKNGQTIRLVRLSF